MPFPLRGKARSEVFPWLAQKHPCHALHTPSVTALSRVALQGRGRSTPPLAPVRTRSRQREHVRGGVGEGAELVCPLDVPDPDRGERFEAEPCAE